MKEDLQCPVDFISINGNQVRLTAFFVLLAGLAFLGTQSWIIIAFLVIDFFLRSFKLGRFSGFALLSGFFIRLFKIRNSPVDQAPKVFSARLGLTFTSAILIACALDFPVTGLVLASVLATFAFLESIVGFCAGCYVYTYFLKLTGYFNKK